MAENGPLEFRTVLYSNYDEKLGPQWVRRLQKRNFGSWILLNFVVLVNSLGFK